MLHTNAWVKPTCVAVRRCGTRYRMSRTAKQVRLERIVRCQPGRRHDLNHRTPRTQRRLARDGCNTADSSWRGSRRCHDEGLWVRTWSFCSLAGQHESSTWPHSRRSVWRWECCGQQSTDGTCTQRGCLERNSPSQRRGASSLRQCLRQRRGIAADECLEAQRTAERPTRTRGQREHLIWNLHVGTVYPLAPNYSYTANLPHNQNEFAT